MKLPVQHRALKIESGTIDEEARTVGVSFSSETPVERFFGNEILGHKRTEVDLERLNNSAPVLVDHGGDQVGVVDAASVKDKPGNAILRFGSGVRAMEVFQDIVDGIRKNISVGYRINKMALVEETDDIATYRATSWTPLEISVVSTPADITIGVGRSAGEEFEVEIEGERAEDSTENEVETQPTTKDNLGRMLELKQKSLSLFKIKQ